MTTIAELYFRADATVPAREVGYLSAGLPNELPGWQ